MDQCRWIIRRSWRAELGRILLLAIVCIFAAVVSRLYPSFVVRIGSVSVGSLKVICWLLPLAVVLDVLWRIYNVRYVFERSGIEAREGILALRQRVMRIKFEDVRSVEFDQTLVDRLLNIGVVFIDTIGSTDIEITMNGVASPRDIQRRIIDERERRERSGMVRG
jgi:uncharacterized membrane protein YdbT with pleckstrin-like domain